MASLQIRLLGTFQLRYQGEPVATLPQARPRSLLAYLLLRRETPQPRQHLAFLFWPDSTQQASRSNLRSLLHRLREAFPPIDDFLVVEQQTVEWKPDAPFCLDVAQFETALEQAEHAETPTVVHLDTLGRPFLSLAHNVKEGADEYIPTYTELDIEGNPLAIYDGRGSEVLDHTEAIGHRGNRVMRYRYAMGGLQFYQQSMDAGERWVLPNVAGDPIRAWDSRGHTLTMRYDILQRPTHRYVQPGDEEYADSPLYPERVDPPGYLAEHTVYGDGDETSLTQAQRSAANLLGQVYQQHDGAGVVTNRVFDFKGNLLESWRQVLAGYRSQVNWADDPALEDEIFTSRTTYDALDRPLQVVTPHNKRTLPNVIQPTYNEANLLERTDVWLRRTNAPDELLDPDTADLHPIVNINYDAKGQRTRIAYGNGVTTTYDYDPRTFRLTNLTTMRPDRFPTGERRVQDLSYAYDPVGNITAIRDEAQQTVFFANTVVEPSATYRYDALYRLIHAEGREHATQHAIQRDERDVEPVEGIPFPNSPEALLPYVESYLYDSVGNIRQMDHRQHTVTAARPVAGRATTAMPRRATVCGKPAAPATIRTMLVTPIHTPTMPAAA